MSSEAAYAAYYYNYALGGKIIAVSFYSKMTSSGFRENLAGVFLRVDEQHPETKGVRVKAFVQDQGEAGEEIILNFVKEGCVYVEANEFQEALMATAAFEF